jgi:hypothetical protein
LDRAKSLHASLWALWSRAPKRGKLIANGTAEIAGASTKRAKAVKIESDRAGHPPICFKQRRPNLNNPSTSAAVKKVSLAADYAKYDDQSRHSVRDFANALYITGFDQRIPR